MSYWSSVLFGCQEINKEAATLGPSIKPQKHYTEVCNGNAGPSLGVGEQDGTLTTMCLARSFRFFFHAYGALALHC
jgi:hypothetical protein